MENFNNTKLGNNIKKLRGDKNQKDFAELIGVSQGTLSKYEKGMMPPADILYNISKIGNSSMEELLTGLRPEAIAYSVKDQEYINKLLQKHENTDIERMYVGKLISMFRAKDKGVISAITQNIDTFLRVKPEGVQEEVEEAKKTAG